MLKRERLDVGTISSAYAELIRSTVTGFLEDFAPDPQPLFFLLMHHPHVSEADTGHDSIRGSATLVSELSQWRMYVLSGHTHQWTNDKLPKNAKTGLVPLCVGSLAAEPRGNKDGKVNGFNVIVVDYDDDSPNIESIYRIRYNMEEEVKTLLEERVYSQIGTKLGV